MVKKSIPILSYVCVNTRLKVSLSFIIPISLPDLKHAGHHFNEQYNNNIRE